MDNNRPNRSLLRLLFRRAWERHGVEGPGWAAESAGLPAEGLERTGGRFEAGLAAPDVRFLGGRPARCGRHHKSFVSAKSRCRGSSSILKNAESVLAWCSAPLPAGRAK